MKTNPPALPSDGKYPPCKRQLTERQLVWDLMHGLDAIGYKIHAVDDGERRTIYDVHPGRQEMSFGIAFEDIFAFQDIFAVDEAKLIVRHPNDAKNMVIFFVFGNDGWDCVNDHSEVEGDAGFTAFMNAFDFEGYAK